MSTELCIAYLSILSNSRRRMQLNVGEIDTSLLSRAKLKALARKQVTPKKILLRDKLAFVTGTVMAL